MRHRITLALAAAALLAACSTVRVTALQSDEIAIPVGARYAWQQVPKQYPGEDDPSVDNEIVRGRIERAVDAALAAKGMVKAGAADKAEFMVSYHVGVQKKRETRVRNDYPYAPFRSYRCGLYPCWPGWAWGYYGPPQVTQYEVEYQEGGVILEIVERTSGKLAWRGIYTQHVTEEDVAAERIDEAMRRLTRDLKLVPKSAAARISIAMARRSIMLTPRR